MQGGERAWKYLPHTKQAYTLMGLSDTEQHFSKSKSRFCAGTGLLERQRDIQAERKYGASQCREYCPSGRALCSAGKQETGLKAAKQPQEMQCHSGTQQRSFTCREIVSKYGHCEPFRTRARCGSGITGASSSPSSSSSSLPSASRCSLLAATPFAPAAAAASSATRCSLRSAAPGVSAAAALSSGSAALTSRAATLGTPPEGGRLCGAVSTLSSTSACPAPMLSLSTLRCLLGSVASSASSLLRFMIRVCKLAVVKMFVRASLYCALVTTLSSTASI